MDVNADGCGFGKSDRTLMEELIGGNPDAMGALYARKPVPARYKFRSEHAGKGEVCPNNWTQDHVYTLVLQELTRFPEAHRAVLQALKRIAEADTR